MVPAGVVIAGLSESNSEGVGDPRDMYLMRTDSAGNTSCSLNWVPPQASPSAFRRCRCYQLQRQYSLRSHALSR